MSQHDTLYRYLFDQADVRGELVQLPQSYRRMLENHDYPAPVRHLLGQTLAATSLLTAILKFEGEIAVQLQGDGPVRLLVINGTHKQELRGVARFEGEVPEGDLQQLFGKGHLVITITPKKGERYQGIVALDKPTLAECLEQYFAQSEQLRTRLWLRADDSHAGGMLLQELPATDVKTEVEFEHLEQLTDTIKDDELLRLAPEEVLHRLYHQESVQVFEPSEVVFRCTCSRERSLSALATINQAELDEILAEQGFIEMHCEYCNARYKFDGIDIAAARQPAGESSQAKH